jgi:uncharacterized protein YuzE
VAAWSRGRLAVGEVALDFDACGRLLGIEVLHASAVLPAAVLTDAVRHGSEAAESLA